MLLEKEITSRNIECTLKCALMNVTYTGNWIEEKINSILKPYGISEQQYNVLLILKEQQDKPSNLFMIQERMIYKNSNSTRLVEKLRQKGFVERKVCPANRRMVEIKITEQGLGLLENLEPIIEKGKTDIHTKWTKEEAELLCNLLNKVRE